MGLRGVFKKIGGGVLRVGKFFADFADIPFAKELVVLIPVVGPALAIAIKYVDEAERVWSDVSKSGEDKRAYALVLIERALDEADLNSKKASALLELAVLLQNNEALIKTLAESEDDGDVDPGHYNSAG